MRSLPISLLVKCARLCAWTYETPLVAERLFRATYGIATLYGHTRENVEVYVYDWNGRLYIVFRGTDSLRDWARNLHFHRVMGPFEEDVHEGFNAMLTRVLVDVIDHAKGHKHLVLTGHSQGAALATLAAAHLHRWKPTVVTFGSPRVGSRGFGRELEKRAVMYRVINNNDFVTRLPPRSFGYRHVGQIVYIDDHGKLHDDVTVWRRFLDRFKLDSEGFRGLIRDGVEDHFIPQYVRHLEAAL